MMTHPYKPFILNTLVDGKLQTWWRNLSAAVDALPLNDYYIRSLQREFRLNNFLTPWNCAYRMKGDYTEESIEFLTEEERTLFLLRWA